MDMEGELTGKKTHCKNMGLEAIVPPHDGCSVKRVMTGGMRKKKIKQFTSMAIMVENLRMIWGPWMYG